MEILKPINIQHKILFGTEIEFYGVSIRKLAELINSNVNLELVLDHKINNVDFSKWYLDIDSSVKDNAGNISGGEVSSKIMTNRDKDYEELVAICEFLKNNGAKVNETCSNHVHVSINEDYDFNYFFEVFAKVISVYELELIHFFNGERETLRKQAFDSAQTLNPVLLSKLETLKFEDNNMFYRLLHGARGVFMRNDGVNLQNYLKTGQIEFRYPNGSLNPYIIKNNIRMCLLIIDAILSYRFDLKELNKKIIIMNHDEQAINKIMLSISEPQKFEELVNVISPTSDDKRLLLNQYNKVAA